jgi:hypothetical protein
MGYTTSGFHARRPTRAHYQDFGYLVLAALGLGAVLGAGVIGMVVGAKTGTFWSQPAAARAADRLHAGQIGAVGAWNPMLLFVGISLLMTTVVVVLRRVITTIRARGETLVSSLPGLIPGGVR